MGEQKRKRHKEIHLQNVQDENRILCPGMLTDDEVVTSHEGASLHWFLWQGVLINLFYLESQLDLMS